MKYFTILLAGLLLVGCAEKKETNESIAQTKKELPTLLFQTVDEQNATLVQDGKNKRFCARCGMDLVRYYKTSHAAILNDKEHQYCSIHCLEEHLGMGITVKNPRVVDVTSLKFISVMQAHYVVGSKMRGTMSQVSKYAFDSLEDAQKFQTLYGGEIMDFSRALTKAKEDFKHYR
ncbi:MAG: nitrous oxide reductase accessory protein NosL [Sulfurimonadaceae bacterium]|jgi:nitrous oxide reductase accessory protein NosL|nr:nitrous oxide reductase accessory protein NosL [Sulfurimonadaceae bacterium]